MGKAKSVIIKSATTLGIGAFISKFIGVLYRVPLTNLIGGAGLGLYQMIFPLYCVLLDFSGAGVPTAISKIIAEGGRENLVNTSVNTLRASLKLLLVTGSIGTALMATLSFPIAKLQGDINASLGYVFLSPSVFLVSIISCFRGYFQGKMNMTPTAVSQIIEQVSKLAFGLLFAYLFMPNIKFSVAGALLGVTVSEVIAVLYLLLEYRKSVKGQVLVKEDNVIIASRRKAIVKTTLPITLVGIAIPLSQVIDSFMFVNLMGKYILQATTLYGIMTGAVYTIINLPVAICYGISTVAVPTVSGANSQAERESNINKVFFLTLVIAVTCVIFIVIFAPTIIKLLYGNFSNFEYITAVRLLRILSVNVIFLSMLQTSNAVLVASGKLYTPLISMSIGIVVKTIINFVLLNIPRFNIYGGAIGVIACYFLAFLINFILISFRGVSRANKKYCDRGCKS